MKKTFLFLMLLCCNAFMVLAQKVVTQHEVQRGETLASVARQYDVTEEMVKEANPQMGDFFYVGLKLNIPEKKTAKEEEQLIPNEREQPAAPSTDVEEKKKGFLNMTEVDTSRKTEEVKSKETESISYNPNAYVEGKDVALNLHFKDYFALSIGVGNDLSRYLYSYLQFGITVTDSEQGKGKDCDFSTVLGIGAKHRMRFDNFLLQFKLYPYAGIASYTDYKPDDNGKQKSEVKCDFYYGAVADVSVGLKAWTTKKGNDTFFTIGYYINAPEFKTEKLFENGMWGIGITTILN